jgi:hypothetical protein
MGSGIRKNSEIGGNGGKTCGIQMSYDICYQPPTFIFKLDEALELIGDNQLVFLNACQLHPRRSAVFVDKRLS